MCIERLGRSVCSYLEKNDSQKKKDSDIYLEEMTRLLPPNSFTAVIPLTADRLYIIQITIKKVLLFFNTGKKGL